MLSKAGMVAMPDDERKAKDRARRAKQFQDIDDSLARATDLIDQSKREVERTRQIMKDSDAAAIRPTRSEMRPTGPKGRKSQADVSGYSSSPTSWPGTVMRCSRREKSKEP
jgi:hypothetical protein